MTNWLRDRLHELTRSVNTAEEKALRRFITLMERTSRDRHQATATTREFFARVSAHTQGTRAQLRAYIASDEFETSLNDFAREADVDLSLLESHSVRDERVRFKVFKVLAAISTRVGSRALMGRRLVREPRLAMALAGFFASQELFDLGQKAYSTFRPKRGAA